MIQINSKELSGGPDHFYCSEPMKFQKGWTLIEAMLSMMIGIIAVSGLLYAFSYGSQVVEREGIQRQALGHIQSQLEQLKEESRFGKQALPVGKLEQRVTLERELFNENASVVVRLSREVSNVEGYTLKFQTVNITLWYERSDLPDTLDFSTRFYLAGG